MKELTDRYALSFKQRRIGKYRVIAAIFNSDFRPSFWNESLPLGFQADKIDFLAGLNLKTVLKPQTPQSPVA